MSLRKRVRQWFGFKCIEDRIELNRIRLHNIETKINDINHNIRVHNSAIGRLIAKLDPMIGVPEDDPARVAASKDLGEDIIQRLEDEAKVHKHYGYIPGDQS